MLPQQQHDEPAPPQVLLEDLTLVIDVALLVAFATAVHLLRQKLITVATLAHALSVAFLVFTVGHYIERHIIGKDGVEDLVSRRGPGRGGRGRWWLASWPSAGLLSIGSVMALVARFWNCREEGGDCVVGGTDPLHNRCKMMRLRYFSPVFSTTVVFVYLCISSRLNALLGGSVLHPRGGGYALAVLVSPALLSTICLSGCASVWLYAVLVEEQASGDIGRYYPETYSGAFGSAPRTKRQRHAKKYADDHARGVFYPNRREKGGHAQQRWSPNHHRNLGLNRHDKQSSSPSPASRLGVRVSESDFEASSSSFLFGGGQGVGGGVAGFGGVGRTASSPSPSISSKKRWQQQQQQRDLDGAAVAWDSGPQGGSRRVGGAGGGLGSLLGGRDALETSDAASQKAFPLRPSSESGSILGGRNATGGTFRRKRAGAESVSSRGSVVADPAPTPGPPFLPLPGGVGIGGSSFGGAGAGRAVKRPLLAQTVGSTKGWTSSSSSSSSSCSSASVSSSRERRRSWRGGRRERWNESRRRSDGESARSTRDSSSSSSEDDNNSDRGGVGGGGLRTRPPTPSLHAKLTPSSFGSFDQEEDTRRPLRHHGSGGSGSSGSSSSSNTSSSSTAGRVEEEEWSAASSGRWGRATGESRTPGIESAAGVHAYGWGGGGGTDGVGHARGFVGGRHSKVHIGTGGGGTAGSLVRRRGTHGHGRQSA